MNLIQKKEEKMANCDYEPSGPVSLSLQMGATILAVGALAGLAGMVLPLRRSTCGSSRSAHIKWQQRKAEIQKVIAEENNTDHEKVD